MGQARSSLLIAVVAIDVALIVSGDFLIFTSAHHDLGQFFLGAVVFVVAPAGYWIRHSTSGSFWPAPLDVRLNAQRGSAIQEADVLNGAR